MVSKAFGKFRKITCIDFVQIPNCITSTAFNNDNRASTTEDFRAKEFSQNVTAYGT